MHMVPMIRNILGGFLFTGDDVYKQAGVLSGGERTRLAVARMLLRPSNTLLLDEPTNHLDLDSKDVLLDALADYGGTLIFVSHDRYFVERLATKIVEVGGRQAVMFPGTYPEFLWRKEHPGGAWPRRRPSPRGLHPAHALKAQSGPARAAQKPPKAPAPRPANHRRRPRDAQARAAPSRPGATASCRRAGRGSPTWRAASRIASARSPSSKRRWRRPASTSNARRRSRSSIGTRR